MRKILFILLLCCSPLLRAATYSYSPSQMATLKDKLNGKLTAGDVVYLENGVYTDFQAVFSGNGTSANPITLKARNEGKVVLAGSINLKIGGSYMVVDGLVLKDGQAANGDIIEFRSSSSSFADHCRLTNCVIDNCNNPDEKYRSSTDYSERWVMFYGKNNRVDHCYFVNKINGGVLMMVNISDTRSQANHHLIDHNFFGYHEKFTPGNNAETIRIGDSSTSQFSSQTTVSQNFFYSCDGETEIVSIKSCDNIISRNTFYESQGGVVCRHGHRNTICSNLFIGNNKANCAGIRIINQGHRVYDNFLQEIAGTGSRSALCVMTGIFEMPTSQTNLDEEPLNAYHRVRDVEIYNNTFINCKTIDLGTATTYTYSTTNPYHPGEKISGTLKPQSCLLSGNFFFNPEVNTMLNRVDDNASEITFADNLYNFKKKENTAGFAQSSVTFEKIFSGPGKGIYLPSGASMDQLPYAADPDSCGTAWYNSQKDEMTTIVSKTIFQRGAGTSIGKPTADRQITIRKEPGNTYSVSSEETIDSISVFSTQGRLLDKQIIQNNSGSIYCPYASGVYILCVLTSEGSSFSQKIFLP